METDKGYKHSQNYRLQGVDGTNSRFKGCGGVPGRAYTCGEMTFVSCHVPRNTCFVAKLHSWPGHGRI